MVTFQVPDMTCGHCASTIKKAIAAVDTTSRIDVDMAQKLVHVTGAAPAADLAEAIHQAGYSPQQLEGAPATKKASGGCGCGCGPRKTAALDAGQQPAVSKGSCCS